MRVWAIARIEFLGSHEGAGRKMMDGRQRGTNAILFIVSFIALAVSVWAQDKPEMQIVTQSRQQTKILLEGKEIAIHHSGEALDKPYIHPLWTPDHHCVTYDGPADHLHHRALSIGWPDVSGTDFWAEINSPAGKRGRIQTQNLETKQLPEGGAQIVENNRWLREDGTEIVRGKCVWTFWKPVDNLQQIDVDLKLQAVGDEVVFGSDSGAPREYHGLTIRIGPLNDIRYINSEGTEGGQKCKGQSARWCAAAGLQQGSPVTVAILDHPSNDRRPTRFYIQDQGMQFISSSPNYGQAKILKKEETWNLRYRVIAAGKPEPGKNWDLEDLWQQYSNAGK